MADDDSGADRNLAPNDAAVRDYAARMVRQGRDIFRFDTFGDEAFWGGVFTCIKPSPAARMEARGRVSVHARLYLSD